MDIGNFFRFDHIWIQKLRSSYLFLSKNISKFLPFSSPNGSCALPFDFLLERETRKIFSVISGVESYTYLNLDFLLFDNHEYRNGIFPSVILVIIFRLQVYLTCYLFLKTLLTESILIFREYLFKETYFFLASNNQRHKYFPMKISSLHWNEAVYNGKEKLWWQATSEYQMP